MDDSLERINELPEELLIQILALLEPSDLHQAGEVCRRWRRIVMDDSSWRQAFKSTFTRRPFERLQPTRIPNRWSKKSWVEGGRLHAGSWRFEYIERLRLSRQWADIGRGDGQKRLEYNVRASSVDRVIVSERYGWALAVSKAGRAAVKSMPMTGKVFARDNVTQDIVFAMPRVGEAGYTANQEERVCSLSTRIDRIVWGYSDGRMSVTHLTKYGTMLKRVVARDSHVGPVFDTAGPLDQLAQQHDWRSIYESTSDDSAIASAGADGSVHVWSDEGGETLYILHGVFGAPLVRVTWAEGSRYVIAASPVGALFVWDMAQIKAASTPNGPCKPASALRSVRYEEVPWLSPAADEYTNGRIQPTFVFQIPGATGAEYHGVVQLAGDPYGDSFIVATENGGVLRMSVDGKVLATFKPDYQQLVATLPEFTDALEARIVTAVTWKVDDGQRNVPGFSRTPSRSHSELNLASVGSRKGKEAAKETDGVLRLNLSNVGSPLTTLPKSEVYTRLLVVGDAGGNVWMYDSDAAGLVHPVRSWAQLHRHAVSALSINACILVSAARDGQVFVVDPVSSRPLRVLRCRGGGRGDRRNRWRREHDTPDNQMGRLQEEAGLRRIFPWFSSIHPAIMNAETRNDIFLAQLLATRTSEQWLQQTRNRPADSLDRITIDDDVPEFYRRSQVQPHVAHGFPTLVSHVASGYGWLVVANGTRLQSCFVNGPLLGSHTRSSAQAAPRRHHTGGLAEDREREIVEGLKDMELESRLAREKRIADHDRRMYYEREFGAPSSELGLGQDEQLAYALWLSSQHDAEEATPTSSRDQKSHEHAQESPASAASERNLSSQFALEGMSEEEQLEYALFLSRSASEAAPDSSSTSK